MNFADIGVLVVEDDSTDVLMIRRAFKKAVGSPPSEWREQHIRAA